MSRFEGEEQKGTVSICGQPPTGDDVGNPFQVAEENDGNKKFFKVGEVVLAAKLGCSKEDAWKILLAGNRMGVRWLDLNSAEDTLKWINKRDRLSLESRLSNRSTRAQGLLGTSSFLKVYTSRRKALQRGKKQVPPMKTFSWNVKGLELDLKRSLFRRILRKNRVDIVFIQETKREEISNRDIREIWGARSVGWQFKPPTGNSSGLLILWKTEVFEFVDTVMGDRSISVVGRLLEEDVEVMLTNVYGPNLASERDQFWEEIYGFKTRWQGPWCIGGDFNAICFPSERRGRSDRANISEGSLIVSILAI